MSTLPSRACGWAAKSSSLTPKRPAIAVIIGRRIVVDGDEVGADLQLDLVEPVAGAGPHPGQLLLRLGGTGAGDARRAEPAGRVVEVDADDVGEAAGEREDALAPAADEDRRVRLLDRERAARRSRGRARTCRRRRPRHRSSAPSSARRPRPAGRCARPARSIGTPSPSYSAATQPAPSPTSTRPSESMSSVASSLASTTGWCRSTLKTRQPTRRLGRDRRGGRHRRDRGDVDRAMPGRLGDRAGAEVVIGREQRAVAEVLGAPGELGPLLAGLRLEGLDGEAKWTW